MRVLLCLLCLFAVPALFAAPPELGETAPDFDLPTLSGERVRLSALADAGPVALIFLRGYPGYQCPLCDRQVRDLLVAADQFEALGVKVVLVYPGAAEGLQARAEEFAAGKALPKHFQMALDPNYQAVNLYGIRWDAEGETAYPSTFLLRDGGKVFFRKISETHGGRTTAAELIEAFGG